jgi:hypothetical protein
MSRKRGSITASELRDKLVNRLGIVSSEHASGSKKGTKKPLTRKEKRKLERSAKKSKVVAAKLSHRKDLSEKLVPQLEQTKGKYDTGLKRSPSTVPSTSTETKKRKREKVDLFVGESENRSDPEDIEIQRLEKLLGLGEGKSKAAKKLNKVNIL